MADRMRPVSYRDAGVDLGAAEEAMARIRGLVESTRSGEVVAGFGAFAGLWRLPAGGGSLLAATIDGVGTKLRVAQATGRHRSVAADLVNHCVDDLLVSGARPAFCLDYFGCGRLDPGVLAEVVAGLAEACHEAGCVLLGGETAEMPGFYAAEDYDLALCMVGMAREETVLGAHRVREGDRVLGLPSRGLHTNGFSLARKVLLEVAGLPLDRPVPGFGRTLADELLEPHRSYLALLWPEIEAGHVSALAHVTGGGIPGNLARSLPASCDALVRIGSWPELPIFDLIRRRGNVAEDEMRRVFNLGIGMLAVVPPPAAAALREGVEGRGGACYEVGEIVPGRGEVRFVPAA